jgi:tripartite-type tricarboxylate transporter receptor subunit TctC
MTFLEEPLRSLPLAYDFPNRYPFHPGNKRLFFGLTCLFLFRIVNPAKRWNSAAAVIRLPQTNPLEFRTEKEVTGMSVDARERSIPEPYRGRRTSKGWSKTRKSLILGFFILCFLAMGQGAPAQEYPAQSITWMIDRPPGSGTDVVSRVIAPTASKILGREIIPVNKPGAGGAVAAGILASAKPDGYTVLAFTMSGLTVVPHIEKVSYDPLKDIIPIAHFGTFHCAVMVRPDCPHNSFKDMIDYARKNPGKVSFGIVGVGNAPHLDFELVLQQENVNIPIVPFGGAPPTLTALLGGHVTAAGVGASNWMPNYKAGKVKLLATTTEKRILPEVPALREFGYPFHNLSTEYYLIAVPKGTPAPVVAKLEGAIRKAMETPEYRTTTTNLYVNDPNPLSKEAIKALVETLYHKNKEVIQKAKLGK